MRMWLGAHIEGSGEVIKGVGEKIGQRACGVREVSQNDEEINVSFFVILN